MAADSDLEKTESPSQRRLDQAREEGQVARSRELSTFAMLAAGGAGLWLMGSSLSAQLLKLLHDGLSFNAGPTLHSSQLLPHFVSLAMETLLAFLPLFLLLLATAAFSPLLLNGWLFTLKPLQPNFSRLDPLAGIARMLSSHGWVELGKALAKALVVGAAGAWAIWHNQDAVMQLIAQPLKVSIPFLGSLMWNSFLMVMVGMLLIVLVDVPFQLWEHSNKLKMTKEEVRQEARETEGDPQVKARIRSMQRELARKRMMAEIPKADVVVTNPTHYAVALRYSENKMRAPIVVAKGTHLLAARIREIATEHHIPIVEAPPLARALYKHTELEHPIPDALFIAVAEVLAYVYQLRHYYKAGGVEPVPPKELPVPPQLDPEADKEGNTP